MEVSSRDLWISASPLRKSCQSRDDQGQEMGKGEGKEGAR